MNAWWFYLISVWCVTICLSIMHYHAAFTSASIIIFARLPCCSQFIARDLVRTTASNTVCGLHTVYIMIELSCIHLVITRWLSFTLGSHIIWVLEYVYAMQLVRMRCICLRLPALMVGPLVYQTNDLMISWFHEHVIDDCVWQIYDGINSALAEPRALCC